ncbi:MAG TPA: segregation/condensation protein A [Candidatus Aminicenantes bacterium]|nr:segregation/condensation protein A [Candidatus Aminicenantes bacterium]HRY64723.1 segregation/condensation protein A [Candidatus Aminicenantes bacterium]HRZ71636.1 segregation/condensation protein A [Candidatus Aminicenantes bacterium]
MPDPAPDALPLEGTPVRGDEAPDQAPGPAAEVPEAAAVPAPVDEAEAPTPAAGVPADGYQVRLDVFEGPLDLLLFLIRKKKIDIHDIPIAAITRDYLGYLERKTEINLDREAEFVFIAALLIYIKSQMLLPRETDLAEGDDPRRVLVDRLVEYERVKAACSLLREREDVEILQWKRDFVPPFHGEGEPEPVELSLFDLAESFFAMMKRKTADDTRIIRGREVPVEVKMKELVTLLQARGVVDFLEYFEAHESLEEALVSFFCILELVKSRVAVAVQDEIFQTIRVWLRKDPHRTAAHE